MDDRKDRTDERSVNWTAPKQEYETYLRLYCSYWSQKSTDLNGGCGLTVCYARLFTIVQAEQDQNKYSLY